MTEQQLRALGPALAGYLDRFLFCCDYTQTFAHLVLLCEINLAGTAAAD
jgi:hypothetical protein